MLTDTRAFLTQGFRKRVNNSLVHSECAQEHPALVHVIVGCKGGPFLETRNRVIGKVVAREKMEVNNG